MPSRASRSITGRVRLPEAAAVAAVHDDHVHAPRERPPPAACSPPRRGPGSAAGASRERAPGDRARRGRESGGDRDPTDRREVGILGQQVAGAQRHHELRHLLERVAARGIRVGEHEPPEAEPVRPRRAGAQVVVDRAPEDDREERRSRRARRRAAAAPATAPAAGSRPAPRARAARGRAAGTRSATSTRASASVPASARSSGPSGARPTGAAQSSTSSG